MKAINQIVIIDDNKIDSFINQKICSLAFEKAKIKTFNCSVMALDYFKKLSSEQESVLSDNVDLILLDINMPLINGFEFLKKFEKTNILKKNMANIYFLSSSNIQKDIYEASSISSCSGYIVKPLTKDKLFNAINCKAKKEYSFLNNRLNERPHFSFNITKKYANKQPTLL